MLVMSDQLRELQENFQAYILNEDKRVLNVISSERAPATDRLDIYREGYSLRILEVMEKDFPNLFKVMGNELFEKAARQYIEVYPSDHFSICYFSRHFSKFLLEAHYEAHFSEIAAFEWALSRALEAPDANQITVADLSTVAPESWPYIQFKLHPSVHVHSYQYNAPEIAYAHMYEGQEIPELIYKDAPEEWVVWRFNQLSYFESLNVWQLWMLNAISQEKTFAEICTGLCEWHPEEEVAQYAAVTLRNWIEKGLFSEIMIAEQLPEEIAEEEQTQA